MKDIEVFDQLSKRQLRQTAEKEVTSDDADQVANRIWKRSKAKNQNKVENGHQTSGVNFTNPLMQSTNGLTQRVCQNQFHQQNLTQLYQHTQLDFYASCSATYASKLCIILLAQKLLNKTWWNWPLESSQFHQQYWWQSRTDFAQIICDNPIVREHLVHQSSVSDISSYQITPNDRIVPVMVKRMSDKIVIHLTWSQHFNPVKNWCSSSNDVILWLKVSMITLFDFTVHVVLVIFI